MRIQSLKIKTQPPEVFYEKGVIKNFTGKHLCLRPATLSKKRLWRRCFPVNFVEFLRTPFLQNLRRLLLTIEACNFIKKETMAQMFSCKCCGIFKNTFFTEHLRTTASDNSIVRFPCSAQNLPLTIPLLNSGFFLQAQCLLANG